ncbi:enoyl-CoA delta isomerase 1, mitochondrial-like isoform X1 [Asterias rubens]|uniref:enoyl-CoA delta isomerase 1, mitochondrial-like isoform X1 n=2 Tax=Asterias rubens TaxID=7604 RepID=UPI00145512D2|nr:enoyl-CoA delta isomerase 1, mitochondrial-like isoform X1 [Asterias rubens]
MSDLWKSVIGFWTRFYGTRMVTIAAINGHAPAGGCLIALSCDYRIMAQGNYNIGFSAVKLGMYVPYWVHELMSRSCGRRTTEKSLQMGLLYKPDEALRIGLIDEVVHPSELLNAARKQMSNWLQVPDHARMMTKEMMRAPLLERIHSGQDREIARMTDYLRSDTVQRSIGAYIEKLKNKKLDT